MSQYFIGFKDYLIDILPYLAIGLFLSGLIHEFAPSQWVERHLGSGGVKPLFYSTLAGTVLPICCFGALPVAVSLRQKGARLGIGPGLPGGNASNVCLCPLGYLWPPGAEVHYIHLLRRDNHGSGHWAGRK